MKKPNVKEIKNYTGQIFTCIIVMLLVCYLFVGVGLRAEFDETFWTIFGISFVIMLSVNTIWYPIAKQKEEERNTDYKRHRLAYSILVDRVRDTNNFSGLKQFCEYATNENKIECIKNKLSKHNIDFAMYLEGIKDIDSIDQQKNLDNKQKKILRKLVVNGVSSKFLWMKFSGYETINHNQITTAIDEATQPYETKNTEKAFDKRVFGAKILTSILCTFGIAMIVFDGKGFDIGKLAQIMTWIFVIFWNIFTAINNGTKSIAVYRVQYYKKLRNFLEEFCASKYYDNSINWIPPQINEEEHS